MQSLGAKVSACILLVGRSGMVPPRCFYVAAILLMASVLSARAADEIQVYNAEIAKVGQWTFQLHNNYAFIGRKEPDFPGGLVPNHALQGTGEWAYGITDWWEMGFYTPYAVDQELTPYSNAIKIRQLFVIPMRRSGNFSTASISSSATLCRNSWTRDGSSRCGRSSDGVRVITNSSSTRSSTLGWDKMVVRISPRLPASRVISVRISPSGLSITPTSDGHRTGCPSMSNNTISMQWSILRS